MRDDIIEEIRARNAARSADCDDPECVYDHTAVEDIRTLLAEIERLRDRAESAERLAEDLRIFCESEHS